MARVLHVAEMRIRAVDAEGQLVQVGRSHDQRAGRAQSCHYWRIALLHFGFDGPGAGGQRIAAHRHEILDANGHASKRPDVFIALEAMIQAMGFFHDQRRIDRDEGIQMAMRLDATQKEFGDLHH